MALTGADHHHTPRGVLDAVEPWVSVRHFGALMRAIEAAQSDGIEVSMEAIGEAPGERPLWIDVRGRRYVGATLQQCHLRVSLTAVASARGNALAMTVLEIHRKMNEPSDGAPPRWPAARG